MSGLAVLAGSEQHAPYVGEQPDAKGPRRRSSRAAAWSSDRNPLRPYLFFTAGRSVHTPS
ncbi:MAG: hypothetical protein AW07_02493 [Candidatus Accumulibacter sp. SK-11]|nr:MAG: hypothetical protein AW07_02493 [Candidatus Accumulibacter sp. SK-11]